MSFLLRKQEKKAIADLKVRGDVYNISTKILQGAQSLLLINGTAVNLATQHGAMRSRWVNSRDKSRAAIWELFK